LIFPSANSPCRFIAMTLDGCRRNPCCAIRAWSCPSVF
jgi:hypothetical protein